jgi:hypothetical protein
MPSDNHTTVQTAQGGDIILVGEEHGNSDSAALMDRVLDEHEPAALAQEREPNQRLLRRGAMGAATSYARRHNLPTVKVDIGSPSEPGLMTVANEFTAPIEEDGDLDPQAIEDARTAVRDEYDYETYRAMYIDRERAMAANLQASLQEFGAPIICALGAFHILSVRELVATEPAAAELPARRIAYQTADAEAAHT